MSRLARQFLALALLSTLSASLLNRCAEPSRDARAAEPATVALAALELAARRPLVEARVAELFSAPKSERERVALLDTLESVDPAGAPVLVSLEQGQGEATVFADVALDGPHGGRRTYRLKLEWSEDRWRVVWLAGPGIEWPTRRARTDTALSISAHPSGAGER